jgi:hypothetical protein
MKKNAVIFFIIVTVCGCSRYNDNKISIINESDSQIIFNFRASIYTVNSYGTLTIKDIPNGTFSYETTYGVPIIAKSSSVNGNASGDLAFNWNDTHIQFYFSSKLATDSTYTLNVSVTSDMSSADVTTTSH